MEQIHEIFTRKLPDNFSIFITLREPLNFLLFMRKDYHTNLDNAQISLPTHVKLIRIAKLF